MTLKPHIPDALRSLRARVFFAVLVVGMIPVVVAVGWLWLYDETNVESSSGLDYSAEVYRRWSLSPDYVDPLDVGVDGGLLRLKKSGRLSDRDFDVLAQRVQALTDATGDSGAYDYTRERITAADAAAYRESRQTVFNAGVYAALGDDQVAKLRSQGYYWGPGTYWYQELQPGGDPEKEYQWVWNSTTVPTVAWMTGKDRVAYVQVMPPEANAGWQESMAWWYALLLAIGLFAVAGLGLLAATLATRGVRKPLRLATAEAEGASAAAAVEVVPLSGPPEVKRLTAAVNRLAAQSSRAQRAEQSFLLSVSHELKTPLTSLRGYGEGLKDGALDAATAGKVIVTESSRLERFVQDLLDSARFGRGEFTVKKETVDLEALARDVVERHRAQAESLGVGLAVESDASSLVLGDPDRVVQVISNLVENAVRCTPSGGAVTVTVARGEVAVSDTGSGLGADDLEHAFDRFYLHNRYGSGRDVGTGLGLAIVKDLVEKMEGSVAVASELGVRSTFTVRLPEVD
jgi:signal transduction histidine kinase